jgi:hypothetical protein
MAAASTPTNKENLTPNVSYSPSRLRFRLASIFLVRRVVDLCNVVGRP